MTKSTTSSSRRRPHTRHRTLVVAVLALVGPVLALSACGSSAETSSGATPSTNPTTSAEPAPTSADPTKAATKAAADADCSERAILSAVPGGATMEEFECARVGDTEWAAARVAPGPTVFFLQWQSAGWKAEDSDSVCGTASAGLPQSLLSYCEATAPSPRPAATRTSSPRTPTAPATEACTSKTILAALPGGATMQKFSCAEVGGTKWAAARVNPGSTVFFLQWNGSRWNAEDSDSVCGTASAGLPQSLLSYCK